MFVQVRDALLLACGDSSMDCCLFWIKMVTIQSPGSSACKKVHM